MISRKNAMESKGMKNMSSASKGPKAPKPPVKKPKGK